MVHQHILEFLPGHLTEHFEERRSHRGLRPSVLDFILDWARPVHGTGAVFLTLRQRDLPPDLREDPRAARARDWVIAQTREGAFLTCYRRPRATAWLRKRKQGRHFVRGWGR